MSVFSPADSPARAAAALIDRVRVNCNTNNNSILGSFCSFVYSCYPTLVIFLSSLSQIHPHAPA